MTPLVRPPSSTVCAAGLDRGGSSLVGRARGQRHAACSDARLDNGAPTFFVWLFQNVFQPSVKLLKKIRKGSRLTRVYDKPKTPWQRVLLSKHSDPAKVKALQRRIVGLDPFMLSEAIDKKLLAIKRLVAKGPVPQPRFHPDWGRRRLSDVGSLAGIPTSTLALTVNADNSAIERLQKNLRKERFLQTS